MEDTGGVEGITRREFLIHGAVAAGAAGAAAVCGSVYADALDKLAQYRDKLLGEQRFAWYTKLFGRDPILADGTIEKISYDQWERDQRKGTIDFKVGLLETQQFMNSRETRQLYKEAFGADAYFYWEKDRKKVASALLHGIHVPDYEQHRVIRELLKRDGILDFEAHKKAVEQGLRGAPAYLRTKEAQQARDVIAAIFDEQTIDDAAHGLEQLYLLTLPVFDGNEYKKIEDDMYATIQKGMKALEKAKNLEQALDANDAVKAIHQLKSFITGFKDVLQTVGRLTGRSLAVRTGVYKGLGVMNDIQLEHPEMKIQAFDYIADEWNNLDLHGWANKVAADAKKLVCM